MRHKIYYANKEVRDVSQIREGDIVVRKSYGKDILFFVEEIQSGSVREIAILKGLTIRITADSCLEDLERVATKEVREILNSWDENLLGEKAKKGRKNRLEKWERTGKILHLDGDRRYAEKSARYYARNGLEAVVKNIKESEQARLVGKFVERYQPDIVVITGHDGMIKKKVGYNDMGNYRNSRFFMEAVKAVRRYSQDIVVFAGACQSYYEGLIEVGANFASSPARILIDFKDPLVVACKIATTDCHQFLMIQDFEDELRDGRRGINGIGSMGKKEKRFTQ